MSDEEFMAKLAALPTEQQEYVIGKIDEMLAAYGENGKGAA